jgi:hypothetical protein
LTVAKPAVVVAVAALNVPQAPAGFAPPRVKVTTSPSAGAPPPTLVTLACTDRVLVPSAGTVVVAVTPLKKVTRTVLLTWVCVTVAEPLRPALASVAVIVHVPGVGVTGWT